MDNPWDSMRAAVQQARDLDRAVTSSASAMADLLRGRLHRVDCDYLRDLKRELRGFDMVTGKWKRKP